MATEKEELIWLPESLVKKIKEIKDTKEIEKQIFSYIEESKRELKLNLESLDDDVLQYKAMMVKAKNAFEEAKTEQLNASYAVWEKYDEELGKVRAKVAGLKKEIEPITQGMDNLNKAVNGINAWNIEGLLKTLEQINQHLVYGGETGNILRFLFSHYKKLE